MMTELHFVPEPAGGRPRTIAHALELLRDEAGLSEPSTATISVGTRLPASMPAFSFFLVFDSEPGLKAHGVFLPACSTVRGIRLGHAQSESFNIHELDQAVVNTDGEAVLKTGLRIRAIEADPVALPEELSRVDWKILVALIDIIRGQRLIYRSLRKGIPKESRRFFPDRKSIDFTALHRRLKRPSVRFPSLKELQYGYAQRCQGLQTPSIAKISDTLRRAGLREL